MVIDRRQLLGGMLTAFMVAEAGAAAPGGRLFLSCRMDAENNAFVACFDRTGRELFAAKTCNACHAVRGHGAMGVQGPDLTHFGSRTTLAAGLIENNPEQLRRWLRDPESVKPGNKMAKAYRDNKITLSDAEQVALTAYLLSLK